MPAALLRDGLGQLGQSLPAARVARLLDYLALFERWNRRVNLSAVREPRAMVSRHLLDCLAVRPWVRAERCLDLGSGGGLPGLVLAIAEPAQRWTLLDANGKKTRFLTQARIELALDNVEVVNARAEKWQNTDAYPAVISRAFTALPGYAALAAPHCASDGAIWAMVGRHPAIAAGTRVAGAVVRAVHRIDVPFEVGQRHLVHLLRDE